MTDGSRVAYQPYSPTSEDLKGTCVYGDSCDPEVQRRFRVNGYNDVWATCVFLVNLLGIIVLGAVQLGTGKWSALFGSSPSSSTTVATTSAAPATTLTTFTTRAATVTTTSTGSVETAANFGNGCLAGLGFAVGLTLVFLVLMKVFAKAFIWVANSIFIFIGIGIAVAGGMLGNSGLGLLICGIVLTLISALFLLCVRHRIPFSALLLECSTMCVMRFHGTVVFAFVTLLIGIVYYVWWVISILPTLASVSGGAWQGLLVLFVFLFFFTTQVFTGVVHVTTSGTVATWFFVGNGQMPPNPSVASFKRAMTTSFGSICFGSLIVGLLKTLEYIVRAMISDRNFLLKCIAMCILGCIRRLMEYFNLYAFSHIAIYGCDYMTAAKLTWNFIQNFVWSAVINDVLVDRVFALLTVFNACAVGVICFFVFSKSILAALGGALVAIVVNNVVFNTVASGVVTMMVCVAEAPDVFHAKHPELSTKLNEAVITMQQGCCGGDAAPVPPQVVVVQAMHQPSRGYGQPMVAATPYPPQGVPYGQPMVAATPYPPQGAPYGQAATAAAKDAMMLL